MVCAYFYNMKQHDNNKEKMKAMVYTQYGPPQVLHLKEVTKPVPLDNEVLIRIKATAVNSGDWRLRKADPAGVRLFFGLMKPNRNILGGVLSGEIESVGKNVKRYKVGDQVFGATGMSFGAYAEYKCLPENGIFSIKPGNLSHEEAAVIPFGGTTALHFIRKAKVSRGQKVLIFGASGAVGTAAVQLAVHLGAEVTAACSTANLELVKSLGASSVIDYTREDYSKDVEMYDVVYDTVNKSSYSSLLRFVRKDGTLVLGAAEMGGMMRGLWTSLTSKLKVLTGLVSQTGDDVNYLKGLIEAGQFKPVIDRTYSLEQLAEAHEYVEKGHKKGNVAIRV